MKKVQTNNGGVGFAGMLTILFIGLKLTECITWSWWLVLSPLWISFALLIIILIVLFGTSFGSFLRKP